MLEILKRLLQLADGIPSGLKVEIRVLVKAVLSLLLLGLIMFPEGLPHLQQKDDSILIGQCMQLVRNQNDVAKQECNTLRKH
jgi:hypothetical protein